MILSKMKLGGTQEKELENTTDSLSETGQK